MDATNQKPEPAGAEPAPPADERSRARAYLDLWERQLVWLAVHAVPPAAEPPRPPR